MPPRRSAHSSASDLTVRSSAGSTSDARAIWRASAGAVGAAPAREQPIGKRQRDIVERGEAPVAAFAHAPQHGVDEIGETLPDAVGAALIDRERDRGMRRRLQQQELRRGGEQDLLEPA